MPMFRKKPVVIEARQFFNDGSSYALIHWINEGQYAVGREFAQWHDNTITVPTLEGQHIASSGDWIIRGVAGEHYPCKPDIFDGQWGTSDSPNNCTECGSEWSSGERLHTGDDKGLGGWEDWMHCKACGCEMFFPVTHRHEPPNVAGEALA